MKNQFSSNIFWMLVLIKFLSRFYLAFPAFLLLLFGIGSFPCLVIGLLLTSVNFVLSVSDARILKRTMEEGGSSPIIFTNSMGGQNVRPDDSAPDIIDVEATERDYDDDDNDFSGFLNG